MVKVSVIMPVFNEEENIEESIYGVLNQTLDDIEIICINDGSSDNTLNILNNLSNKYPFIKIFSQENQGVAAARNNALRHVTGEYVAFLDGDDFFIDDNALEVLYNEAILHDANMVSGNLMVTRGDGVFTKFKWLKYYEKKEVILPEDYGSPFSFTKAIFKTEFLISNDIYFPLLTKGEDPVFLAHVLSKIDKIYAVPCDVYGYRYVDGSNKYSSYKNYLDQLTQYKLVFDYLKDSKFDKYRNDFRKHFLSFVDFIGPEGIESTLKALNDVFKDDGYNKRAFEYKAYMSYRNNDDVRDIVKIKFDEKNPRISVVIPVYNAEPFLQESINSLLNQTFTDFELICVNDGSKDNSLKILEEFAKDDNRVRIIDQPNGGCGAARNRGLKEAKGDFVYFFDPDDFLVPTAFQELYKNAILNNSDLVLFKLAFWIEGQPIDYSQPHFDLDNYFTGVDFYNFVFSPEDIKKYVMNAKAFAPWFKLYKKELLDKFDDFQFPVNLPFDDVPFHIKSLLRASRISFVPEFFYHYRIDNPNSVNSNPKNSMGIIKIIDIVDKFLRNEHYIQEFLYEFYNFKIYHTFIYFFRSADSEEFFQAVKKEYVKMKEESFSMDINMENILDQDLFEIYNMVLNSNSFLEYKFNFEKDLIEKDNKRLISENRRVVDENQSLISENRRVVDENQSLISEMRIRV